MFVVGGLDCLEVFRLANVSHISEGWGAMFPSHPRGSVELPVEDCEVGGPPRFGVMGGPGDWRMFLQEGGQSL